MKKRRAGAITGALIFIFVLMFSFLRCPHPDPVNLQIDWMNGYSCLFTWFADAFDEETRKLEKYYDEGGLTVKYFADDFVLESYLDTHKGTLTERCDLERDFPTEYPYIYTCCIDTLPNGGSQTNHVFGYAWWDPGPEVTRETISAIGYGACYKFHGDVGLSPEELLLWVTAHELGHQFSLIDHAGELDKTCIMYHKAIDPPPSKFCPACQTNLRTVMP